MVIVYRLLLVLMFLDFGVNLVIADLSYAVCSKPFLCT